MSRVYKDECQDEVLGTANRRNEIVKEVFLGERNEERI